MILGLKLLVQIVGKEGRVVVLRIHVGARGDQKRGNGILAMKRGLVQRGIAVVVLGGDSLVWGR